MDKKQILIIDDEENFTRLVKINLELTGKYEVRIENKGASAITTIKAIMPDLILLDVMMPGVDGPEVAAKMKEDKDIKDIPVIFLTAIVQKNELEETCSFIGGHSFLAKPVNVKDLVKCIDENIRVR